MLTAAEKTRVCILGFDQALSSTITGAMDLFALAGISWQRIQGLPPQPLFEVKLATHHGAPITCINGLELNAHMAIQQVTHADLLLIPTIGGNIEKVLQSTLPLQPFIRRLYQQGADIAANCTGNFILAETQLLNGGVATTHWGYADLFRQRYPRIDLQADKMVTQHERIFCAGGGMAWFDLTLLLIDRYCGHQVARDIAKSHVLDLTRPNQTVYAASRQRKHHQDNKVLAIQEDLEAHYQQPLQLESLAARHSMTVRTLLRRFKQACGQTPGQYLQTIRIEHARRLLEQHPLSLDQLVRDIGYEDQSSFSRLFKKSTGLSPAQYRQQHQRK